MTPHESSDREFPLRPIAGVGAIVRKGNQVLLIRRGQPPLYGEWSIPGGAIELGEGARDAARREVFEECGIEIEVGQVAEVVDIIQRDPDGRVRFHYVVADYAGTYRRGELKAASDALQALWVPLDQVNLYVANPLTRQVIAACVKKGDR